MTALNPFGDLASNDVDTDLLDAMEAHSAVVCLARAGTPTIYVSDAFEAHTGYLPSEAIGRSLAFLQGPDTEETSVNKFRQLIADGEAGTVRITNYRKDNAKFVHECELRPVRSTDGIVTHFIAIQRLLPSQEMDGIAET